MQHRTTGHVSVRGADLHSVAAVLRALSFRAVTSHYPYLEVSGLGVLEQRDWVRSSSISFDLVSYERNTLCALQEPQSTE